MQLQIVQEQRRAETEQRRNLSLKEQLLERARREIEAEPQAKQAASPISGALAVSSGAPSQLSVEAKLLEAQTRMNVLQDMLGGDQSAAEETVRATVHASAVLKSKTEHAQLLVVQAQRAMLQVQLAEQEELATRHELQAQITEKAELLTALEEVNTQ